MRESHGRIHYFLSDDNRTRFVRASDVRTIEVTKKEYFPASIEIVYADG